jgi:hypothetical protein
MNRRRLFAGIALLLGAPLQAADSILPDPPSGAPTITASYPSAGKPELPIGMLKLAGAGKVHFFAHLDQGRLLLKAVGPDGTPIGRAESVVGLGDTPIYVRSTQGLLKVLIHWKP